MASNLKGLDEALSRVRSPLENLRAEVDELRAAAALSVKQLEGKLNERQSILCAHRRLELLLDAEQGLQRMEALLLREVAAAGSDANEGEAESAHRDERAAEAVRCSEVLERVANEVARLKGQVLRLDETESAAVKQELLSRINQLEEQLIKRTNSIFGTAIAYVDSAEGGSSGSGTGGGGLLEGRETVVKTCCRVYMVSARSDECQSVIRQEAVRPFIAAEVTVKGRNSQT